MTTKSTQQDRTLLPVCRYYFDTEFIEDGTGIWLISIGIVCPDGREYYAEVADEEIPWERASQWVLDNVRPHLVGGDVVRTKAQIAAEVVAFIGADTCQPEFWAFVGAYDWVVLCGLYGSMVNRPAGWPMLCLDLKQKIKDFGLSRSDLPVQEGGEHNALPDARWVMMADQAAEARRVPVERAIKFSWEIDQDRHEAVMVTWQGGDRWAIRRGDWQPGQVYNEQADCWEWEPINSARSDAFLARTRYSRDRALTIARHIYNTGTYRQIPTKEIPGARDD